MRWISSAKTTGVKTMNEKIKAILGEELATQVTEKLGDIELAILNDGSVVPADKHDNMKAELKATQEQLNGANEALKGVEGSEGTIEELKAQMKAKSEEFEAFKTDTVKRETTQNKKKAFNEKLIASGFTKSSAKLLAERQDYDAMNIDSKGNIVDIDTFVNPLKTEYSDLVTTIQPEVPKPPAGDPPTDDSNLSAQAYFDKAMKG